MKKNAVLVIMLVLVIASAILGAALSNAVRPPAPRPPPGGGFPEGVDPNDSPLVMVKGAISTMNITIALMLIALYVRLYQELKSRFTLGLIVVMCSLLLYSATSSPVMQLFFGYRPYGMGPFFFIPDLFATVAMGFLLYLSLE